MKLVLLSVFVAALLTGLIALANFSREGVVAFSRGPWLYIGYFVFIILVVIIGTIVMQRLKGK
jgi:hypothetical protein